MAMEPDILLMDEPFAALDALTRRKMQDELLQLWEDTRFTVLFVTHSIPEAVLHRQPHPAAVAASGPGQGRAQQRRQRPGRPAPARKLSDRIHDILFADRIEEQEAVPHG